MIHDADKKLLLLLPPKTGSQTLRDLFKSCYGNDIPTYFYNHIRYHHITNILTDINLDKYTIYAFYRDPISRFMSTFKYLQSEIKNSMELVARGGPDTELKRIYTALCDENITRDITSISIDDVINIIEKPPLKTIMTFFLPQILYLRYNVTLLDFEDFENNTKMLLNLFGLNNNITIPKLNVTNSSDHLTDLTEAQVAKIKELYAIDYAFFKSRNITF